MLVTANVFQPLIDVFESVLKFFHNSGGISWGWSIVLLTIAVRAVMVPLTLRQIKSMVRMQGFAPQLKEIQQKYKDDKARQQEEMMKFYRENNVNPLGSCLPLVLQLPVFISLYYMLRQSLRSDICPGVQLAHQKAYAAAHHITLAAAHGQTVPCGHTDASKFLFIGDLTDKATGITLVVLIILYVGSQLGSSVLMSSAQMDPTQRRIMMFMPVIFVLFVIRFPAGVLVYWITTNVWTIAQQYAVKRRIGPVQAATAATAGGGGPGTAALASGGSGDGSGGGGLGGRLRERLRAAQQGAGTKPDAASENGPRAKAGNRADSKTRTSGGGARRSGRSGARAATPAPNGDAAANADTSAGSGTGTNGGESKSGPTKSGGSKSGGGNVPAARAGGAPPPRPPRKRKKRSGRRR